jgi:hypothetical protein
MADLVVYTADTDPNHLLGRPGQYTGKGNWRDTGDDSTADTYTVETFANTTDRDERLHYVQSIAEMSPILCEYDATSGVALLRISCNVTPGQDKGYERAFVDATR